MIVKDSDLSKVIHTKPQKDILKERLKLAKKRVKYLRKHATVYEKIMMKKLHESKIKFIFQYPFVSPYYFLIADFYLPKYKILVEVNGSQHYLPKKKEQERKRKVWLEGMGYKVYHIKNQDVLKLTKKKLENIIKKV